MRLIIIANRLPLTLTKTENGFVSRRSEGGLATGLSSQQGHMETLWLGWPGVCIDNLHDQEPVTTLLAQYNYHAVFLSSKHVEEYYEGYCNTILWPLCHYFFSYIQYAPKMWDAYREVNTLFFEAAMKLIQPDDQVWVQDYQLMLLPGLLRDAHPNLSIGYFHHIPFPSFELFRVLPERADVLRGLLGADLIGFHTHDYMRHFISATYRVLGVENDLDEIRFNGRLIRVNAFPMGINFNQYYNAIQRTPVETLATIFRKKLGTLKLILSVDRLDYSKGVLQRLKGFELALSKHPELREHVSFIILLVPSRATVPEYAELKKKIDEAVGALNGRYATLTWTPVLYYYRSFSLDRLLALYSVADVALVTPLRDGMNLVAKEYVVTKRDTPGVLILSERTGAAIELTDALLVNPNNIEEIGEALITALNMPESEQKRRLKRMQNHLVRQSVDKWADDFCTTLDAIRQKNNRLSDVRLSSEHLSDIHRQYRCADTRLILLDYDGTLVPLCKHPEDAIPTDAVCAVLIALGNDPRNTVVISSGRNQETLDAWLGHLPVQLAAEHGAFYKESGTWKSAADTIPEWNEEVLAAMTRITDQTLGAHIEKKRTTLAWHYRNCDAWLADLREKQLIHALMPLCTHYNLHIMRGNKVVEIKTAVFNKGTEAQRILAQKNYAFILAIGDDTTDEDMFRVLPPEAITVRIGDYVHASRFTLPTQAHVLPLLTALANQPRAT